MIAVVWLGYIIATSVHLAQCWLCLRYGKATMLGLNSRVRPIRVKWPMFDVPIFRRKNSDSDGRCQCLVGTVTSVDVDKLRAQAYASMTHHILQTIFTVLLLNSNT